MPNVQEPEMTVETFLNTLCGAFRATPELEARVRTAWMMAIHTAGWRTAGCNALWEATQTFFACADAQERRNVLSFSNHSEAPILHSVAVHLVSDEPVTVRADMFSRLLSVRAKLMRMHADCVDATAHHAGAAALGQHGEPPHATTWSAVGSKLMDVEHIVHVGRHLLDAYLFKWLTGTHVTLAPDGGSARPFTDEQLRQRIFFPA